MKIGVFDSGLGGLLIAKSIREALPEYDMVYFGDTLHLPYGNRSFEALYAYSCRAMDFLFSRMDCNLVIVACNTVSAGVLRRLQQEYLVENYPERRILGVIVPTLECALDRGFRNLGVIATNFTINSGIYPEELRKINPDIKIQQIHTPLLVPLIENGGMKWIDEVLADYLAPMLDHGIECMILGCTHYVFLKPNIAQVLGDQVVLLSQDEIIPAKLKDYLERHPEIESKLSKSSAFLCYVSDLTPEYERGAHQMYGAPIEISALKFCVKENMYYEKEDPNAIAAT